MTSRNLVLFSDGTGNSAGKLFKTNVWRVYQALDLTDPQVLEVPRQFAYYDDGVGTSTFKPLTIAGGAFGLGLARNVIDLYVFLCRTYRPGDRIYGFGFSRGAFTIRVLVEMVMNQGLLRYDGSEADLQRWAWQAYRAYRKHSFPGSCLVKAGRRLRDRVLDKKDRWLELKPFADAPRIGMPGDKQEIKVEFLGLWDTVDAYGLPIDQLTRAIDRFIMPLTMRNYRLNPRVNWARHALSIDDARRSFYPRLWTEENEPTVNAPHVSMQRISQVWFAGVHANVGGGYPDDSLSYVPLLWIMEESNRCGLRFKNAIWDELRALSDENGPLYDSRKGIASYYAYNPRRMVEVNHSEGVQVARAKVHESVLRRIRVDPDGYAPTVLAKDFDVVRINGELLPIDDYLRLLAGRDPGPPIPKGKRWLKGYGAAQEEVFNTIWYRRVTYYLTLVVSLILFALPAWAPDVGACHGSLCFLSSLIKGLDYVVPSFATAWTHTFAYNPNVFLPLLLALCGCFWASHTLDVSIRDRMRRIWYAIPPLRPRTVDSIDLPAAATPLSRLVQKVRTDPEIRRGVRLLTHHVLPFGFVAALLGYAAVSLTQVVFAAQSSSGGVCTQAASPSPWFATSETCHDTGIPITAGNTYQLTFEIPNDRPWLDESIPAGPGGFTCRLSLSRALMFAAAVPARRHPTMGWFQAVAKINETGNDVYALEGARIEADELSDCPPANADMPAPLPCPTAGSSTSPTNVQVFHMSFMARSSGRLYLYVNDVIGVPLFGDHFYANNQGCAKVSVRQVEPVPVGGSQ